MQGIPATLLLAAALITPGCGNRSEIRHFGGQLYDATQEMTKAVDGNPSAHGVRVAYKTFKKRQDELSGEWVDLVADKKLTKQDKTDLLEEVYKSDQKLTECLKGHTAEFTENPEFGEALVLVRNDFRAQFKIEDVL